MNWYVHLLFAILVLGKLLNIFGRFVWLHENKWPQHDIECDSPLAAGVQIVINGLFVAFVIFVYLGLR